MASVRIVDTMKRARIAVQLSRIRADAGRVKWGTVAALIRASRHAGARSMAAHPGSPLASANPEAIRRELLARAGSPRGLVGYDEAIEAVCEATGWPIGHAWLLGPSGWRSCGAWHTRIDAGTLRETTAMTDLGSGRGIVAAVLHLESCRFLPGLEGLGSPVRQAQAAALGLRGVVGVPVHSGAEASRRVTGVLEFITTTEVEPDGALSEALLEVAAHTRRKAGVRSRPAATSPHSTQQSASKDLRDDIAG